MLSGSLGVRLHNLNPEDFKPKTAINPGRTPILTIRTGICRWKFGTPGRARGSIYTTMMELGTKRPSLVWFWGPNSIMVVYMDPLGKATLLEHLRAPDRMPHFCCLCGRNLAGSRVLAEISIRLTIYLSKYPSVSIYRSIYLPTCNVCLHIYIYR